MAHKMTGIRIPDWNEIRTYFTDTDIQHMLIQSDGQLDLSKCTNVLKNAAQILQQVSTGKMPPSNPWSADKINGYYAWWKSGPTCPS
jgi:hypothetical protein